MTDDETYPRGATKKKRVFTDGPEDYGACRHGAQICPICRGDAKSPLQAMREREVKLRALVEEAIMFISDAIEEDGGSGFPDPQPPEPATEWDASAATMVSWLQARLRAALALPDGEERQEHECTEDCYTAGEDGFNAGLESAALWMLARKVTAREFYAKEIRGLKMAPEDRHCAAPSRPLPEGPETEEK